MNISDLSPEQRADVLHHLRAATLCRARQWDHELAIEAILHREVELNIQHLAAGVDPPADTLTPEDLLFISDEDLADAIPDTDEA